MYRQRSQKMLLLDIFFIKFETIFESVLEFIFEVKRTFTSKINSNTDSKKVSSFIKKISNKSINTLINHFSQGNTNATSEKCQPDQKILLKHHPQKSTPIQSESKKKNNKIHFWKYWKL